MVTLIMFAIFQFSSYLIVDHSVYIYIKSYCMHGGRSDIIFKWIFLFNFPTLYDIIEQDDIELFQTFIFTQHHVMTSRTNTLDWTS